MAFPSIVAWTETTYATRTNTNVAVPPGLKAGSMVLVYAYIQGTRIAITPPTGFTEVAWSTTPSVGTLHMRAFWKIATAADTGTYVFTHASASTRMWAYEVDNATGVETTDSVATSATATTSTPAVSLTTTGADRLLVHWSVVNGSSGNNLLTASSGFSEWWDAGGWYMATKGQVAAGATGAVSATGSPTSSIASLLAIIPKTSLYVEDTFTGTNGAVPTGWTVGGDTGLGGSATINSNEFRLLAPGGVLAGINATRSTPTTSDDLNLSATFQANYPTLNTTLTFYLHVTGSFNADDPWRPTSGYALSIYPTIPSLTFELLRYTGGAGTVVASGKVPELYQYGGFIRVRFQAFRSTKTIRFRLWREIDPEPSIWNGTYTDTSPLPVGKVAIAAINTYGGTNGTITYDVDNLVVTDLPEQPTIPRVVERWNGTSLVPMRTERWSGNGFTVRKVENAPPRVLSDNFDRVSSVSPGVATTGQVWITSAGSTWGTDGYRLYNVSQTDGHYVTADVGSRLLDLTATLSNGARTPGAYPEIMVAGTSATSAFGYYWIEAQPNGSMRISVPFGSLDATVAGVFATSAAHTIRVRVQPITTPAVANRITVWVNGAQVYTVDDTAADRPIGTRIGFRHAQIGAVTTQQWDYLTVLTV